MTHTLTAQASLLLLAVHPGVAAASSPARNQLVSRRMAIRFALGVLALDQTAAFGVGDLVLLRWPDLLARAWPLAVAGELVQESWLLVIVAMCCCARSPLLDTARPPSA